MAKYPTEQEFEEFDFSKYKLRQLKAIRLKCLDCCCFMESEVRQCTIKSCPLFPYRLGHSIKVPTIKLNELRKDIKKAK